MNEVVPVSVVIPTYRRVDALKATLRKIASCKPQPDEIVIHVDGNDQQSMAAIADMGVELDVQAILSLKNMGPGGGRNILIRNARNELVVSFDDDSYPVDPDFFDRVVFLMNSNTSVSILGAAITHRFEQVEEPSKKIYASTGFIGCGCVYRKSDYIKVEGYIPIRYGYGIEESDIALQYLHAGLKTAISPWLRVFHDTELTHHRDPSITSASISNLILLTYLRYPFRAIPFGIFQVLNRIFWLVSHGRTKGIVHGIVYAPLLIKEFKRYRDTVSLKALRQFRELKIPVLINELE